MNMPVTIENVLESGTEIVLRVFMAPVEL